MKLYMHPTKFGYPLLLDPQSSFLWDVWNWFNVYLLSLSFVYKRNTQKECCLSGPPLGLHVQNMKKKKKKNRQKENNQGQVYIPKWGVYTQADNLWVSPADSNNCPALGFGYTVNCQIRFSVWFLRKHLKEQVGPQKGGWWGYLLILIFSLLFKTWKIKNKVIQTFSLFLIF